MAKYTNTLNLKKPDLEDFFDVSDQNGNMDIIDSAIEGLSQLAKSVGTSNAIELSVSHLKSYSNCLKISFVASANNNGTATTVNVNQWGTKNLYKPNTTTAPVLIAGKAYDIWFDEASDCFFLKASAEGNAIAANVLAGKTFSNDDDTGITGTIPSKGAATITPGTTNQTIAAGQYLSGVQTIQGSANLVAGNIRSGVNIFGVVGNVNPEKPFGYAPSTTNWTASINGIVQSTHTKQSTQSIKMNMGGRVTVKAEGYSTGDGNKGANYGTMSILKNGVVMGSVSVLTTNLPSNKRVLTIEIDVNVNDLIKVSCQGLKATNGAVYYSAVVGFQQITVPTIV
ncbi:hypothetical protein ACR6HW_14305 [Fusibacter sp. JL298sf-3]